MRGLGEWSEDVLILLGSRIHLEKLCKLKEHLLKVGSLGTFLVPHRTLACIGFLFLIVPECLRLY